MKQKLKCILLIDDDEPTNFINKMIINKADCTESIEVCKTAMQALDFLKTKSNGEYPKPNLILLDINMPGINGWEFLEEYSTLPISQQAEVVLVMLTTSLNPDDKERAESIPQVSGFKNKPLSKQIIHEILSDHFPDRM